MGTIRRLGAAVAMAGAVSACSTSTGVKGSGLAHGLDSSSVLSAGQLESLRMEHLAIVAKGMHLADPPKVELVRWIDLKDYAAVNVTCLLDQGFPARADGGQGIVYGEEVPVSQDRAYTVAIYTCEARYPVHPYYSLPPSRAALSKLYDWYVKVSRPCLERAGYDIPAPPSSETWTEAYLAKGQDLWTPWSSIPWPSLGEGTRTSLEETCPQGPDPSVYLEHVP